MTRPLVALAVLVGLVGCNQSPTENKLEEFQLDSVIDRNGVHPYVCSDDPRIKCFIHLDPSGEPVITRKEFL